MTTIKIIIKSHYHDNFYVVMFIMFLCLSSPYKLELRLYIFNVRPFLRIIASIIIIIFSTIIVIIMTINIISRIIIISRTMIIMLIIIIIMKYIDSIMNYHYHYNKDNYDEVNKATI